MPSAYYMSVCQTEYAISLLLKSIALGMTKYYSFQPLSNL